MDIYLTNSLTRKKEKFEAISPPNVGMYTCGPTVYDYAHIGNYRTYTTSDILLRTLSHFGYKVNFIMNITDVGHLSGDNLGDADTGEDRLQKAATKEKKTAWDIARFYTKAFIDDFVKLNLTKPELFTKATDYIKEQIDLVRKLEEKGYTYKTSDGIYFDTREYNEKSGFKYGELSDMDKIKEGARIEVNKEKRDPHDFALWKFSPSASSGQAKRQMEWESPWGIGFPGWHVECSAMSMKYLGETFDVHVGGEDIKQTHHVNEIAQSQAVSGKIFVKYWIHGAFLTVDGGKMGKSLGNAYTVSDVIEKGFDPLALRYFYLTGHYRSQLNFTWEALKSASTALTKLWDLTASLKNNTTRTALSEEKRGKVEKFRADFESAIADDLNTPQALAAVWNMAKSNIPSEDKYDLLMSFDEVLGLSLSGVTKKTVNIPPEIVELARRREELRKEGKFTEGDLLRDEISAKGYAIKDTKEGTMIIPKES